MTEGSYAASPASGLPLLWGRMMEAARSPRNHVSSGNPLRTWLPRLTS